MGLHSMALNPTVTLLVEIRASIETAIDAASASGPIACINMLWRLREQMGQDIEDARARDELIRQLTKDRTETARERDQAWTHASDVAKAAKGLARAVDEGKNAKTVKRCVAQVENNVQRMEAYCDSIRSFDTEDDGQ